MYEDKGQWEPYPDEINVIIERAYSSNQPIAEWSESKQKFKVTFSKMVEDCGDVKNTVKVKRSTKGKSNISCTLSTTFFSRETII